MYLEALLKLELSTKTSKKTGPCEIGGHSELRVVDVALNVHWGPSKIVGVDMETMLVMDMVREGVEKGVTETDPTKLAFFPKELSISTHP